MAASPAAQASINSSAEAAVFDVSRLITSSRQLLFIWSPWAVVREFTPTGLPGLERARRSFPSGVCDGLPGPRVRLLGRFSWRFMAVSLLVFCTRPGQPK